MDISSYSGISPAMYTRIATLSGESKTASALSQDMSSRSESSSPSYRVSLSQQGIDQARTRFETRQSHEKQSFERELDREEQAKTRELASEKRRFEQQQTAEQRQFENSQRIDKIRFQQKQNR